MKKCVMRNVLALKTNSTVFWCLPLEIIVIFVKQPEMKELWYVFKIKKSKIKKVEFVHED